jgi:hypothetical protein
MCFIHFTGGSRRITCKSLGIDWPPPDILEVEGFSFTLKRRSQLTDTQRKDMTHVLRGAEYYPSD